MTTNERTMPYDGIDPQDLLNTLEIHKAERRSNVGGAWVTGRIAGYRFEALVFPKPAQNREWEVGGDSRISKLWIGDADGRDFYAWDRGADVPPANPTVEMVVELFSEGLAETIFENH